MRKKTHGGKGSERRFIVSFLVLAGEKKKKEFILTSWSSSQTWNLQSCYLKVFCLQPKHLVEKCSCVNSASGWLGGANTLRMEHQVWP